MLSLLPALDQQTLCWYLVFLFHLLIFHFSGEIIIYDRGKVKAENKCQTRLNPSTYLSTNGAGVDSIEPPLPS